MGGLDRGEYRNEQERFDTLVLRTTLAEAVAYHNLKRDREALACCQEAAHSDKARQQPHVWIPHIYRDQITAITGHPRFVLADVEALARKVKQSCDHLIDPSVPLLDFMIDRVTANAYLRHGNIKKATRLLRAQSDHMDHLPVVGPLHRTLFLRTYAQIRWTAGDREEWYHLIQEALKTATHAGLTRDFHRIQTDYQKKYQRMKENAKFPPGANM